MHRIMKKVMSGLLVAVMVGSLAACGGADGNMKESGEIPAQAESKSVDSEATELGTADSEGAGMEPEESEATISNSEENQSKGTGSQASAESAEPEKAKLDQTKFENVTVRAEQMGYNIQPVETFSNGYTFKEFKGIGGNKLRITYVKSDVEAENYWGIPTVEITITPKGEQNYKPDDEIQRQEEVQIHEVDIITYLYIHFEMPTNWRDIITEEEQQMLDDGRANCGIDDVPTEIIHHNIYTMMWSEDDHDVCLENALGPVTDVPKEDYDVIVEEWILANQK